MTHFYPETSRYKRVWMKDLPSRYNREWERLGLVNPPVKKDGTAVRSVPFYAAQQLHRLEKVPRQLRGSTKPIVVTTSKIGEPYYSPQLDFDLRTTQSPPLAYNNLLDPHLKIFFNHPTKRRVLEKRGFITKEGDVICHNLKELNRYRDMLYSNHQEMIKVLRTDINNHIPKILGKRKAIAEATSEKRRCNLLRRTSVNVNQDVNSHKQRPEQKSSFLKSRFKNKVGSLPKVHNEMANEDKNSALSLATLLTEHTLEEVDEAATKIQACFKGYRVRKIMAQNYVKTVKAKTKSGRKKIWEKTNHDLISTCHTHSCTESLARQFVITDIPSMMEFLKDPVKQQEYRRSFLLRLMHTPCTDISGTMVKPLLQEEIRSHSSKFRWV